MDAKLQKKLYESFPKLYRQKDLSIQESCMPWGIETGSGWFKLIYDLSKKISEIAPECEAVQVKEKYGTLRFYVNGYNDDVETLIDEYEKLSAKTCEICGDTKTAKQRGKAWISTICNKCARDK
jgi:hypothetical protein